MRPTSSQVHIATRVWFEAAQIKWLKTFPDKPCPIPNYDDLPAEGQGFFATVMAASLRAANDPEFVAKAMAKLEESEV